MLSLLLLLLLFVLNKHKIRETRKQKKAIGYSQPCLQIFKESNTDSIVKWGSATLSVFFSFNYFIRLLLSDK